MIPLVIPPLTGLSVLVTRQRVQAAGLCERIRQLGGEAIEFPAIEIEPIAAAACSGRYDVTIFTSINAVQHGVSCLTRESLGQLAVIGAATRSALAYVNVAVDIYPETSATSENLLIHPVIKNMAGARVLIVRGRGGRELLRDSLQAQGCTVELLEVYERVAARPSAESIAALEQRWVEERIDIVTATSGEIIQRLYTMFTDRGRALLEETPLLVVSARIRDVARGLGLRGECVMAAGANDAHLVGTLAYWSARARALQS